MKTIITFLSVFFIFVNISIAGSIEYIANSDKSADIVLFGKTNYNVITVDNLLYESVQAVDLEFQIEMPCKSINSTIMFGDCSLNGYRLWFVEGQFGFKNCWCEDIVGDPQTVCTPRQDPEVK